MKKFQKVEKRTDSKAKSKKFVESGGKAVEELKPEEASPAPAEWALDFGWKLFDYKI